ncbi:hypothetical protein AVEN_90558-1 [Araneus ventricosus]|uniref:Uncharacterized protein n=1 Tax=Araneus ventricosus TaxID=182803 RepID=A0A4Y2NNM4_ARAVE|nr:hypothetical protein AVEN_90558-1 [Araneus ventricosus]
MIMANVGKRKAFSTRAEKHGVNAFPQNEIEHFECCGDDAITSGESICRTSNKSNNVYFAVKMVLHHPTNYSRRAVASWYGFDFGTKVSKSGSTNEPLRSGLITR